MTSEVFTLTDEQILGMEAEGRETETESTTRQQVNDRGVAAEGPIP
jgi:hypothetical protein